MHRLCPSLALLRIERITIRDAVALDGERAAVIDRRLP
jgi:hypothetical protein